MDITYLNVSKFASENIRFSHGKLSADFTNAKSFDTFSYIYLACCLFQERKRGHSSGVLFPQGTGNFHFNNFVWKYFDKGVELISLDKTIKIPYRSFDIDVIEERLKQLIFENDINVNIPDVIENVSEITDNVRSHAVHHFMFLRVHYSSSENYFDVAIGDVGVGIKATLVKKSEFSYLIPLSHREAILKSVEPRVTSKADARGLGLTMVSEYFSENPTGIFFLCSGDGYYMAKYNENEDSETSGNLMYNIDGVQTLLRFYCEK